MNECTDGKLSFALPARIASKAWIENFLLKPGKQNKIML